MKKETKNKIGRTLTIIAGLGLIALFFAIWYAGIQWSATSLPTTPLPNTPQLQLLIGLISTALTALTATGFILIGITILSIYWDKKKGASDKTP